MKKTFIKEDYRDELLPVNPAEVAPVSYPKNISLDQLVDRYLMQYEREAIDNQHPLQEKSWRESFKAILEAEGDIPDAGGDLGGGGDLGALGGDPAGGAAAAPAPSQPNVIPPDINVERFAELVFGLMQNYDSLLDPKTTIMNRSEEYLAKNYSPRHAEKLGDFLQTKYGVGFDSRANASPDKYAAGAFGDAGTATAATPAT